LNNLLVKCIFDRLEEKLVGVRVCEN